MSWQVVTVGLHWCPVSRGQTALLFPECCCSSIAIRKSTIASAADVRLAILAASDAAHAAVAFALPEPTRCCAPGRCCER